MPALAELLGAIAWPLVSRVLVALGIGVVTYAGADGALNTMLSAAKGAMSGLSGPLASYLAMAGVFDAMSAIAGGLVSGLAFMTLKKLALQSGT
jgi:hypothetical protein